MFDTSTLDRFQSFLSRAKRIALLCHRNPDGDALGSLSAMAEMLASVYPSIPLALYCRDKAPSPFHYIPSLAQLSSALTVLPGDVFIVLDSAEPKLTDFHEECPTLFTPEVTTICIDHHGTNTRFATLNIVHPEASSTCEVLTHLFHKLGWNITSSIATSLLTGLYTDTGGLLHSNTTARVYRTVATLLRAGGKQQTIVDSVFRTMKASTLKLWGRVLEHISLTDEGGAISAVTEGDFRASGADYSELTGAIDYVNAIPGMRFSLVLAEKDGKVKGSIRTLRDDVDVAKMASKLDGGGHKKAAGFAIPGKLTQETRWKVRG